MTSFEKLLDVFWEEHNPCGPAWSTQYKAILFYNDDAEKKIAEASAQKVSKKKRRPVTTELKKLERFYFAEDYHQKYSLRRNRALYENIRTMFDSERAFSESTVATKVNAYLDGHIGYSTLQKELGKIGLKAIGARGLDRVELAKPTEKGGGEKAQKPASRPTSRPVTKTH